MNENNNKNKRKIAIMYVCVSYVVSAFFICEKLNELKKEKEHAVDKK